MVASRLALVALVATGCLVVVASTTTAIDVKNPVRSAQEDEIQSLPGLSYQPNFKHYSGYLEADDLKPTNRFWHYWFVESQSNPSGDPLVLWLNGGPGCSSLLGLLTELGPFRIAANNTVVENVFAWNKRANVLFVESPAGVGYSYAADGDIKADDDSTAKQNHLALKSFLRKFPQYKNSPLYLTGESYGGVYLPTLAVLVDEDPEMNLKGVAIGNGYLDANKLAESLVYFSYYHGLVGRSTWEGLSRYCCDGKPPARGDCQIISPTRSDKCSSYVAMATDDIINSGVNPYNLYDQCEGTDNSRALKLGSSQAKNNFRSYRENIDKQLILSAFNLSTTTTGGPYNKRQQQQQQQSFHRLSLNNVNNKAAIKGASLGGDPPCTDDSVTTDYLNRADVRQALHIPDGLQTKFATCFDGIAYTMIYPGRIGGLAPQMSKLIGSPRKLRLLVYNGDIDLMCNFFGDEWFVDDLNREVVKDYSPWFTNNQLSGFCKYYKGIAYFTVKGSGHMVPTDRPAEALNMFHQFLDGNFELDW